MPDALDVGGREIDVVRAALEGDYEILEELGRGGMAVVYRARERELDRDVAVKVLPLPLAFDAELVERFQREAKTAAQLEHPNIIPIYRVGRAGRVTYFVMKYLRGDSLAGLLRARGRLPAPELRRILIETASALGYAARRGVVHRDVKPDNIMLDEDGRCVVTDFGIARSASDSTLTATGVSLGTPRYMSPEQARAKGVDGRSDIYSLGVVGYQCLAGDVPFDADDPVAILMSHVGTPVPRPVLETPEERELFAVIERMMAKRPEERFQSADELIAALGGERTRTGRGAAYVAPRSGGTAYPAPDAGPRPSAALDGALDAAVDAGIQLVRRQRPKIAAGVAAAIRFADAQRPLVLARARAASAIGRRSWRAIVAVLALLAGIYAVRRTVLAHRSRCPRVAVAGDSAAPSSAFSVLVDAVGARESGDDLDVYYDVCGLERGTGFRTRVAVVKNESGLRRLLGHSVDPVTARFDESADGVATRLHHTLELGDVPPGSYSLSVVVTDERGRRRERGVEFVVRER
ncbi:MAG TPA: serine/threonine-protein kinase [Gemmatimonadaceae bacterium]|nr:serine/threonine-protein kinase [Gemmatimonadaceae bacterium]